MSEEKKNKYILKSMINISDFIVGNTDQINQEYLDRLNLYGGKIPSQDLVLNSYASVLDHPIKNKILNNLLHLLVSCYDHMDNVSDELINLFAGIYVDTAMALFLTGCDQGKVDSNTLKLFIDMVNTKFAPNLNKNYDFPLSKKIVKTDPVVASIKLLNRNNNKDKRYLSVLGNLVSKSENNELNLQLGGLYENAKVLSYMPVVARFNDILLNIYSNQQLGGSSSGSKTSSPVASPTVTEKKTVASPVASPTVTEKKTVASPVASPIGSKTSSPVASPTVTEKKTVASPVASPTVTEKTVASPTVTEKKTVASPVASPIVSGKKTVVSLESSGVKPEESTKINELVSNTVGNISYGETLSILNKYVKK